MLFRSLQSRSQLFHQSAITGLDAAARRPGVAVFHSGTATGPDGAITATGGRVLTVTATGPTVRAAREEMMAGKHGLKEFRSNLSRFEPYVELRSDLSDFPNRDRAFGNTVETVVGVQKETFEGGILKTEVGGSFSRFEFDRAVATKDSIESGGGALTRTRLEMPFFGSRKKQDRIISQAYQESTARQAQLNYLKGYRNVVENALSYYNLVVYYRRLVASYQHWEYEERDGKWLYLFKPA